MSDFLNPKMQNPVTKWGQFKAGESSGYFEFWDKSQDEGSETTTEEQVIVMPLFIHQGVAGFSKKEKNGIYSNEIRNISEDVLKVRVHGGKIIAEGIWSDIKRVVEAEGGKFANILYGLRIFLNNEGERGSELIALKFSGSSLGAFINANVNAGQRKAIQLKKDVLLSEGSNSYWGMSIKKYKQDKALIEMAMPYAQALNEYFNYYFSDRSQEVEFISNEAKVLPVANKELSENAELANINAELAMASEEIDIDDLPF